MTEKMVYKWEISLRLGGMVVMRSRATFDTYDEAKTDLIRAIRTDFDNLVRVSGNEYNYTIYDKILQIED